MRRPWPAHLASSTGTGRRLPWGPNGCRPEPNALDNALGPAVSNELHNDDFETVGHSSAENLPPPVFVRVLSMNGLERRLIFQSSLPREMTQWPIRLYPHH
jgi:hypothetical protein